MIRPVSADDAAWMADLLARRRVEHERWSPVFWRRAADARAVHEPFLVALIASDSIVALRDDHGFVIADRDREGRCVVDDFAVDDADGWDTHGRLLLVAAWRVQHERGAARARVVTAYLDEPKRTMLLAAGLEVAEEWWVKPLAATGPASTFGPLDVPGATAVVVPAPPVYDPGGPVAIIGPGVDQSSLPDVEERAAAAGAVLAVARLPDDAARSAVDDAGYELTSQFLEGAPT